MTIKSDTGRHLQFLQCFSQQMSDGVKNKLSNKLFFIEKDASSLGLASFVFMCNSEVSDLCLCKTPFLSTAQTPQTETFVVQIANEKII